MIKKQHIVLVISTMRSGGAERVMSRLANYFASEGHKVTLITFVSSSEKPFYPLNERIVQVPLNCLSYHKNMLIYALNVIKCIYLLRKTFKKLKPDVVISFMESVNVATLLAGYKLQIPTIVSERNDPKYHILYPMKIQSIFNKIRIKTYAWAHILVVQTRGALNFFPEKLHERAVILPNPVHVSSLSHYEVAQNVQHIISVGRLCKQKNHVTLIKAFAKAFKKNNNLRLTIYGEGPERHLLETLIAALKLGDYIHLPGAVQHIEHKLSTADLFVFPSLYEGFPNALCEAMAVGLPVIVSHCSGNIDVIQNNINGLIFEQTNVEDLYEQMLKLIEDYPLRKRLSEKAKNIRIDYHEDTIYASWDRLLDNIKSIGDYT